MTWRAVARSATMEMRCMMPAFDRDRPPSSLLNLETYFEKSTDLTFGCDPHSMKQ
jgi:hypothetical protein